MASKFSLILCIFGIWAIDFTNGASSSLSSSVECSTLVVTMSDCLSFITNGSTITKPEGSCCSALKNVLNNAPSCICGAFKSSGQLGVVLNVSKAFTLPFACQISAPPISNCGLPGAPSAAPGVSLSPAPSPTTSSEAPGVPAAAPPNVKSAASALIPISAGSLLVFLFSLFSGL